MKRICTAALIFILLLGLMAGCTPSAEEATTPSDTTTPSAAATTPDTGTPTEPADPFAGQTLEVAIFEGGYGRAFWDDIVSRFEAAYGVTVNLNIDPEIGNLLVNQTATGDWPDVIQLSDGERSGLVASMIKNNELLELTGVFDTEVLDRPGVILRDIIMPGMLENGKFSPYGDGKVWLAPWAVGPMGLTYNAALFAEKGWKLPSTWDEFIGLQADLDKEENYVNIDGAATKRSVFTYQGIYGGYCESVFWPAVASAGGLQALADIGSYKEGSFSTPAVKSVAEQFARIGAEGCLMEGTTGLDHTQSQTDMMQGKALFIPNGTWLEGEMADAPREAGLTFGIIPPPVAAAGQEHYVLSSYEPVLIPAQAKNPELAKEFLRFIYTKDSIASFAKTANGCTAVSDALEIAKGQMADSVYNMFKAYDTGKFMLFAWDALPEGSTVSMGAVVFDNNIGPLITGELSVDEYCAAVEEAMAEARTDIAAG